MDYSIHDAISDSSNKIIFVISTDIEVDFKECICNCEDAIYVSLIVEII